MSNQTIQIQFNGKPVTVVSINPSVVQKSNTVFYIKDSSTGAWLYCSAERLEKLWKKFNGDLSKYTGRGGKLESIVVPSFLKPAVEVVESEEVK